MLTLGIETSCDETSAAVVENGRRVLSNIVSSSLALHKAYKGIIPEIASRAHIECISLVTRQALQKAKKGMQDISAVCVTSGPGLFGSLLVGISFAKGLCFALKKPLIAVNHLEAHLYASFLSASTQGGPPRLPCIGLVVSGGHTGLFLVGKGFFFKGIGATVDDAAGEAFDKVAKILDLGYPGGPVIEKMARKGNSAALRFSCKGPDNLNFSFSGIKTAVLYKVTGHPDASVGAGRSQVTRKDIAASFQKAVVEALAEKSFAACHRYKADTLVVGGGVAANRYLRDYFSQEAKSRNARVYFPGLALSLDNAAMIAGLGYQLYKRGVGSDYYLSAKI
jgi:N6-L-threonylcarbamoyladenine synthase